jgi:hypothetical protein
MSVDEFTHSPIDEAALAMWLAEVFEVPAEPPAMRTLVGNVRETLVPIAPSPDFVRNLGRALAQTISQRQQPLRRRYRRAVWFGLAAAGSVASIVGVTAYVVHQRDRQHA